MFAGRDGRAILAHLFRCEGFAVCLYSGALRASHLRQTCACKIQVIHGSFFVPTIRCEEHVFSEKRETPELWASSRRYSSTKVAGFWDCTGGNFCYGLARIFHKNGVLVHMRLAERDLRSDRFRRGALHLVPQLRSGS